MDKGIRLWLPNDKKIDYNYMKRKIYLPTIYSKY